MSAIVPRERRYTSSDALALFYRDWGDPAWPALPVLCLPGLTRNSRDFDDLARHLADPGRPTPRRVIAPDLRGRGLSAYDKDWRNYRARVYLDDIRHLLAALGIGRVIVVGTSMGGILGTAMATAMPTALAGLVVNDVGPDVDRTGAARIIAYIGTDRPQPDWPTAAQHLRQLLPTLSLRTDAEWLDFAQRTFREGKDDRLHFDWDVGLAKAIEHDMEDVVDLWPLWRALGRTPALVIRGGVSDILSAATLDKMQATKPDLVQVTLPGIGHCPTLNEPPAREAIDAFLSRL